MTYKQIEACKEARLWLTQVILPTLGVGAALCTIPEVREATKTKFNKIRDTIKSKTFKK